MIERETLRHLQYVKRIFLFWEFMEVLIFKHVLHHILRSSAQITKKEAPSQLADLQPQMAVLKIGGPSCAQHVGPES